MLSEQVIILKQVWLMPEGASLKENLNDFKVSMNK